MAQLANRYAIALFDLAVERNKVDVFYEEVKFVKEISLQDQEFIKFIEYPQISSEDKTKFIETVFKGKISDDIIGLFDLLFRKRRESELIDILTSFMQRVNEHKKTTIATVYSSVSLSESQLEHIKNYLSKNLNKQVEIQHEVDQELIGGLRIKVDGRVIDGTIKKQIDDMKKQLLDLQLAL